MHSTHKRAGMHATAEADGGEDPEPHPPNDELHVLLQFVHLAQHVWRSVCVDTQGVPDARSRNHPVARPRVRGRLHCEAVGDADGGYQEQSHHLSRRSLAQVAHTTHVGELSGATGGHTDLQGLAGPCELGARLLQVRREGRNVHRHDRPRPSSSKTAEP
jgi:ribosomal protein S14